MSCAGCGRDNLPTRRFCGGCGRDLAPACQQCEFINDRDDRFCGGCGGGLGRGAAPAAARSVIAPSSTVSELSGLFDPAASTSQSSAIPKIGIGQDDLDRLFGAGQ